MRLCVLPQRRRFNSMIVRLKALPPCLRRFAFICFNSMIVRLKVSTRCIFASSGTSFNSMIVRLKGFYQQGAFWLWRFQFYDSPIKSSPISCRARRMTGSFNSMIVRLKGGGLFLCIMFFMSFNSMIVRLKVLISARVGVWKSSFNSMIVRLKV